MKEETKTVVWDSTLKIEAYRFEGVSAPFPNHFHEHYVIGLIESGQRRLLCKNKEYMPDSGDILLFNPLDSHACVQADGKALCYRAFNISKETMLELAGEITGEKELPYFSQNVIRDDEIACCLLRLHEMVMGGVEDFGKEENLLLLISAFIQKYSRPFENALPECRAEIEKVCAFIEKHYAEHISLDEICRLAGLSKSALLRAFTKEKGVTPYRYLETVRINEAKALLAKGVPPIDAAAETGFSDQAHFTNYFSAFTGLSPGVYRSIFR